MFWLNKARTQKYSKMQTTIVFYVALEIRKELKQHLDAYCRYFRFIMCFAKMSSVKIFWISMNMSDQRYLRDFMNEWKFSRKFGFNSAVIENPKKYENFSKENFSQFRVSFFVGIYEAYTMLASRSPVSHYLFMALEIPPSFSVSEIKIF